MALATPIPWPRKIPRRPNSFESTMTSFMAEGREIAFPLIAEVCMMTATKELQIYMIYVTR